LTKKYAGKKAFSRDVIEKEYNRKYNLSILKDSIYPRGIYYTWQQFKENKAVNVPFVISKYKEGLSSLYIIDKDGNESLLRDVYAVSDGVNLYKMYEGLLSRAYKTKNAIYWKGLERYQLKQSATPVGFAGGGMGVIGLEAMSTNMKLHIIPYLLNIETGKEY
jgi:hypothetical protein